MLVVVIAHGLEYRHSEIGGGHLLLDYRQQIGRIARSLRIGDVAERNGIARSLALRCRSLDIRNRFGAQTMYVLDGLALRVGDAEKGEILFRASLHRFDNEIVTLGIGQFLIETRRALTQRDFVFSRNRIEYVERLRMAFDTVFAQFVGDYDRIAVADCDTLDGVPATVVTTPETS